MEMAKRKEEEAVVVSIKGRLDAVSSPEFEKELDALIAEGEKDFVIDFAEIDYISSAGLRSILATAKKLRTKDGQIFLSAMKESVKEVFKISGFDSIIPILESTEEALEKFSLLSKMF
jgi:anti-anti-sigma factor